MSWPAAGLQPRGERTLIRQVAGFFDGKVHSNLFLGRLEIQGLAAADWDHDGDTDLLVTQIAGAMRFFENTAGPGKTPEFATAVDVTDSAGNIRYDGGKPAVVDWDHDGDLDVLVGGLLLRNVAPAGEGPVLEFAGALAFFGFQVEPVDWDADGDADLLGIPNGCNGSVQYFENIAASVQTPQFAAGVDLVGIGGAIRACGDLDVVDWNGDGSLDLLAAETTISYFRNTAAPGAKPLLAPALGMAHSQGNIAINYALGLAAVDWESDGDKDLVVVQRDRSVLLFETDPGPRGLPLLSPELGLNDAINPLTGGGHPDLFDWDADGDLDMLRLFSKEAFRVSARLFENAAGPGNVPALLPSIEIGELFEDGDPEATDWDGDGDADLLLGRLDGVVFFENTAGVGRVPVLVFSQVLRDENTAGLSARALESADWDGDGDVDLLVGRANFGIRLYENIAGSGSYPVLRNAGQLTAADAEITCEPCTLDVADWDGDLDVDVLIGREGQLYLELYRQPPGSTTDLSLPVNLSLQATLPPNLDVFPDPESADWDADGTLDLLVVLDGLNLFLSFPPPPLLTVGDVSSSGVSLVWTAYDRNNFGEYEIFRAQTAGQVPAIPRTSGPIVFLAALGLTVSLQRRGRARRVAGACAGFVLLGATLTISADGGALDGPCAIPSEFQSIGIVSSQSQTSHIDDAVTPQSHYVYLVRSRDKAGHCFLSNELRVNTPERPNEVVELTVRGDNYAGNEVPVPLSLHEGDRVAIEHASGMVVFNTQPPQSCLASGVPYYARADGLDRRQAYDNPPLLICYANDQSCTDPLPESGHAGLYLKRNGALSFIGAHRVLFDAAEGESVSIGVNDCAATPNSGSFTVKVTVKRSG